MLMLPPGPPNAGRRTVLAAAALVLLAAGAGTVVAFERPGRAAPAADRAGAVHARQLSAGEPRRGEPRGRPGSTAPAGGTAPAGSTARAGGTARADRSRDGGSGDGGTAGRPTVSVGAAVAGQPRAAAVGAFLDRYFAAIDRHDYRGYLRLFSQASRRALSAAGFRAGYGTTRDAAETLTGLTPAGPRELAAAVTFTSHQAPTASPARSACLRWRITLYLVRHGRRYVITSPPAGYYATERACAR
jgi:hypothetical protein